MPAYPKSPKILHLSWGQIEVEDLEKVKDVKLYPGGGREWDWNETGTSHNPSVQSSDVQELVDYGAKIIVVGQGMYGRLGVSRETVKYLQQTGVTLHSLKTREAVKLYNQLSETEAVGGLFHSTC